MGKLIYDRDKTTDAKTAKIESNKARWDWECVCVCVRARRCERSSTESARSHSKKLL